MDSRKGIVDEANNKLRTKSQTATQSQAQPLQSETVAPTTQAGLVDPVSVGAVASASGSMASSLFTAILAQRNASRQRRQERQQFDEGIKQKEIDRQIQQKQFAQTQRQNAIQGVGNTAMAGADAQNSALARLASLFGGLG